MLQQNLWQEPASPAPTSSVGDSLANPSAMPASGKAKTMFAGSGRKCAALLKHSGPLGLLEKTFLALFPRGLMASSLTWKVCATAHGHLFFRLARSVRRTSASASSLWVEETTSDQNTQVGNSWATPLAQDGKQANAPANYHRNNLTGQIQRLYLPRQWPTPSAMNPNETESLQSWEARRAAVKQQQKNGNGFGTPLGVAVRLWPTPKASDGEHGGPNQRDSAGKPGLSAMARAGHAPQLPEVPSGRLNPAWVELLMGFPKKWTEIPAIIEIE